MELSTNPSSDSPTTATVSDNDVAARIEECRATLGKRLLVLGHHYQGDDIICHSDLQGDSLRLAHLAAETADADTIVFAGVHFMAESADILTGPERTVILPDMRAGCTMADMAVADDVDVMWDEISACTDDIIVPVTYINSSAAVKAFVGRNGGAVCTSSNAAGVLRWAFERGQKVLFLPDQHLGRNVSLDLGIALDEMRVLDPNQPRGGHTSESIADAKVLLWQGHCSVHTNYTPAHVEHWRQTRPSARIIVHPECTHEVVELADVSGSTSSIIQAVESAEPGSEFVIGTEVNLVNRLKKQHPDRFIALLSPFPCLCSTMYRIRPAALLHVLEELVAGRVVNEIRVPSPVREDARTALDRMLSL